MVGKGLLDKVRIMLRSKRTSRFMFSTHSFGKNLAIALLLLAVMVFAQAGVRITDTEITGLDYISVNGTINVKEYGAVGDGVTDDSTAIQNAIDACTFQGCHVYIPYGHYNLSTALNISSRAVYLYGQGKGTVLTPALGTGAVIIGTVGATGSAAYDYMFYGGVSNLEINCTDYSSTGLEVRNQRYGKFEDLVIRKCGKGIHITAEGAGGHNSHGEFYNINLEYNQEGIRLSNNNASATSNYITGHTFNSLWFIGNNISINATRFDTSDSGAVEHIIFSNSVFYATAKPFINLDETKDINFIGCILDGGSTTQVMINDESSYTRFVGCQIETEVSDNATDTMITGYYAPNYYSLGGGNITLNPNGKANFTNSVHIGNGARIAPSTSSDDLVIFKDTSAGISILTANTVAGQLSFGDPEDNDNGRVKYSHATEAMELWTSGSLRMSLSTTVINLKEPVQINGGTLIVNTTTLAVTADAAADNIVIKENGNAGMSILAGTSSNAAIYFGDTGNFRGAIDYDNNGDKMTIYADAKEVMNMDGDEVNVLDATNFTVSVEAESYISGSGSSGWSGTCNATDDMTVEDGLIVGCS